MSTSISVLILQASQEAGERMALDLVQEGFAASYARVESLADLHSRLSTHAWDIILVDPSLPGLDLAEAIQSIHRDHPDIPVLLTATVPAPAASTVPAEMGALAGVALADRENLAQSVRRCLEGGRGLGSGSGLWADGLLHRAYFEQLFANSPQSIVIVNNDDKVVEVNRGFENLFGYTQAEAMGRKLTDLVAVPEMLEESRELRNRASIEGMAQRETVRVRKDGREVQVLVVACPITAGSVRVGLFWIYTDISARKTAEDALRLAEMLYRGIVQNAVMGIFQATLDLKLTMANPALADILGCSSTRELLDRPELCELFLNDPAKSVELWRQLDESGEAFGFEVPTRRLDGRPIWLALNVKLVQAGTQAGSGGQRFLEGTVENVTARKLAEERLRLAEEKYRTIFENAQEGIFQTTPEGRYISANPALARIYGYDSIRELMDQLTDIGNMLYIHPGRRAQFIEAMHREGQVAGFESQVYRKDGRVIWISEHARLVRDEDGRTLYYEGTAIDVTKRKKAEEELHRAEAKYRSIFENSLDGIFQCTPEGRYISANPALARIYGYASPDEFMAAVSGIDVQQPYVDTPHREEFRRLLEANGQVMDFESEVRRPDSSVVWISESAWEVRDEDGRLQLYEGLVQDISARKRAEEQLRHQAFHDALTGLPNRILFMDRLGWALHRAQRKSGYRFAVFFLDLDRFKLVNDSLGHMAGDQLLVEVSERLNRALRPMDTVARFGGDEFAVLVDDISGTLDATHILSRLQAELAKPFTLQGRQVFTSASIGVVLKTWVYDRPEHLVRDADIAMYRAKAMGKDRYEIFDSTMHHAATSLLQLETDLHSALERDELVLHYQPIVSMTSGILQGFEALVRWRHSRLGLVLPAQFIPVAEESGLIMDIGSWVLRHACRQLAQWQKLSPSEPPLTMSVNLSAKQFMNQDLVTEIRQVLGETGIPPESLRLEITETKVMENAEFATRMLGCLKTLGVKISIDDFGTGYSSLAYLHSFPLDSLKIDRSFVGKMGSGQENLNIVGAIVNLARNLGLDVVAEGVELAGQLSELKALGCEFGQGFLFSRAVPSEEAQAMLQKNFCIS